MQQRVIERRATDREAADAKQARNQIGKPGRGHCIAIVIAGADVGMMVLDEVLGSLDVERKDLMVNALGRLAGRFHQLFVITHAEQVKDQFPASIEVRKVGRRRSVAELV